MMVPGWTPVSEKRLFGSGIERLMGSMWKPELCLGNALFDGLKERDKVNLNFGAIATTRFQDPIFNNTWHNEWIDHILYSHCVDPVFVVEAQVHKEMADGRPIWEKYRHASDHYPVSAMITT